MLVQLVVVVHPEVGSVVSPEEHKKLERFQRLRPHHFSGGTSWMHRGFWTAIRFGGVKRGRNCYLPVDKVRIQMVVDL